MKTFLLTLLASFCGAVLCAEGIQPNPCTQIGSFALENSDTEFLACLINRHGELTGAYMKCLDGDVFDESLGYCAPRLEQRANEVPDKNVQQNDKPIVPLEEDDETSTSETPASSEPTTTVAPATSDPTTTLPPATSDPTLPPETTSTTVSTTVTTDPDPFKCPNNGMFAKDGSCREYWVCYTDNQGQLQRVSLSCPKNQGFDLKGSFCSADVKCDGSATTETTQSTTTSSTEQTTTTESSESTTTESTETTITESSESTDETTEPTTTVSTETPITEPSESTDEPTTTESTETPITEPSESTDEPTTTESSEPTESTDAPTESTDAPPESTDEPTESTDAPTESTDEPTESTDAPTESPTEETTVSA